MGTNAGMAILDDLGNFKIEKFNRHRVFLQADTNRKFVDKNEITRLLIDCINEATEEYEEIEDIEEFCYRIYWIQKCLSIVEEKTNVKFSIFADTDDHDIKDFS